LFESLRYRWTLNGAKGIALAVALLTAFASFELWRLSSSRAIVGGVVISTGAVSIGKGCGGTRQLASVQLADGRMVYASADAVRPLAPGTRVSLQKQWWPCDSGAYEVVALQ